MFDKAISKYIENKEKSWFGMKQKLLFFKELGYLLWWWVGISTAINVIARDWDTASQRYIAQQIATYINEWKSLTNALTKLPDYFSTSDVAIIKAGESSGNLVTVLRDLAYEYSFLYWLKGKFVSAITYPVVLLVVAVIWVILLFTTILPSIFSIAYQFPGVELPLATRIMMWLTDFFTDNIASIIIAIWLLLFFFSIVLSTHWGQTTLFRFALTIPGFGVMIRNYFLVKMMRYLKLLQLSGMNYVESLTLLHDIMWFWEYQEMIRSMLGQVQRGEQMYKGTLYYPHLIPANAVTLLKVWEETAQLPATIQNVVDIYEEDLLTSINSISKIIEPVLVVFIWVIIAVIALSVFGIITTILGGVQSW